MQEFSGKVGSDLAAGIVGRERGRAACKADLSARSDVQKQIAIARKRAEYSRLIVSDRHRKLYAAVFADGFKIPSDFGKNTRVDSERVQSGFVEALLIHVI